MTLPRGRIELHAAAVFVPDGRSIVISGAEKGGGSRLYLQDLQGGEPRPITDSGVRLIPGQPRLVSPDGRFVVAEGPDQKMALYPLGGGAPQAIPGITPEMKPLGWTDRSGVLFVHPEALSRLIPVSRLDVATGRTERVREFGPEDPIGSPLTMGLQLTPDGRRYAYLYFLSISELVMIDNVFEAKPRP